MTRQLQCQHRRHGTRSAFCGLCLLRLRSVRNRRALDREVILAVWLGCSPARRCRTTLCHAAGYPSSRWVSRGTDTGSAPVRPELRVRYSRLDALPEQHARRPRVRGSLRSSPAPMRTSPFRSLCPFPPCGRAPRQPGPDPSRRSSSPRQPFGRLGTGVTR